MFFAIIVAGGTGSRMNSDLPKQFMVVAGKPVLMHTIEAFFYSGLSPKLILVLHPDLHDQWSDLCVDYNFTLPCTTVAGGATRYESVKNALDVLPEEGIVAIHDGVRPLAGNDLITSAYRVAEKTGNAVAAIESRDSVRRSADGGNTSASLDRKEIFLVQTPQVFSIKIIKEAYRQAFSDSFTDDASVVERAGYSINLVKGDHRNIKITYPEDLEIADHLLRAKKNLADEPDSI